jgi:PAS domain S-box-containing protein
MNTANPSDRQWNEGSSAKPEQLGNSEPMFRMLFERSADAILMLDPQREVFVDCNPAAVQMMRATSKEQLLLTNPADISPQFQPDGRDSREKTHEMIALTLANGTHRFEWLSRRFDGVEFHVEVACTTVQTGEHPLVAVVCRDITDRKNAEAALRESESRFRMLFERSADAMSLFDPEIGRFIESNEAVARQVGAPTREALGNASPVEISPERQPDGRLSSEKAAELIKLALANGSHRFEWMSRRHDGTELPLDIVLTALPSSKRQLLLAISRDISAQKKAEQEILRLNALLEQRVAERTIELVQSNEQLKSEMAERLRQEKVQRKRSDQVERHRDVLLELAQSRKADFEQALEAICSRAAATLDVARVSYWSFVDNNSAIVCDLLHLRNGDAASEKLKGARLAVSDCPAYFAGLASKRPIAADNVFTHPATSGLADYLKPRGIASMLDAPVWMRGEMVGVLCHEHIGPLREWSAEEIDFVSALASMVSLALEESYRSESERRLRESEGRFSAAFRSSPVFITISDFEEGRYILANEAFLKWSGYRLDEVLGRNSAELSLWADPSERAPFWRELRRTGSIRERETRIRGRHGRIYTALLSADLIQISGKPHLLTVGLDITQRKQAEAELLKTLSREKELGLLRSKFVSMVSHEFRTPLGIIQSSAEILDDYIDRLDAGERKEHLQSIQKNTRRMAALMEEVLLIGSFDAGKMEFKPVSLDLVQFAGRLVDEVLSATDRRCPILLTINDLPCTAHADERLLRHIFTNLLTNAVKYSESGETVHFEIACDGADVVCVIRDRGIGIPDADREWLFSAFHRGQNVGERPGTGLGLVIVKRCADAHDGRIHVDSQLNVGTTMTVRLPVFGQIRRDRNVNGVAIAQSISNI